MNPKRLAALLLIAFTLLSLQSAALANAAEPPSFIHYRIQPSRRP